LDCDSDEHRMWQFLFAVPMLLTYLVLLPAGKAFLLVRNGRVIQDELHPKHEYLMRRYGFVVNNMKPESYWWELCRMYRKLLVIAIVTLAKPAGIVTQALLVMMVFIVALAAHCRVTPFKIGNINDLESVACGTFIITVWLAVLMSQTDRSNDIAITISMAVINALGFGFVFWQLFVSLRNITGNEDRMLQVFRFVLSEARQKGVLRALQSWADKVPWVDGRERTFGVFSQTTNALYEASSSDDDEVDSPNVATTEIQLKQLDAPSPIAKDAHQQVWNEELDSLSPSSRRSKKPRKKLLHVIAL